MELKDFPFFAEDIFILTSDEDTSGLNIRHPVSIQPYQDDWLLTQGDERILVTCTRSERRLLQSLVLRDQTRWFLIKTQKKQLQLQYCAPVEISAMDLQLGIDGLISDDLFTKQEIRENNIELACQWMYTHFVVSDTHEGGWLAVARFSNNENSKGFQILGNGWRADIEETRDNTLQVRRVTRHHQRDSAFSLLTGLFTFSDGSVVASLGSACQQAILKAALRDNASYLELWHLYNEKAWEKALKQAETLKALRFESCKGFENGRDNAWRVVPKSAEAYKEFRERWQQLDLGKNDQVELSAFSPDWGEELQGDEQTLAVVPVPRGKVRFEGDSVIFEQDPKRKNIKPDFKDGWLYLSLAGYRTASKRRLAAKRSIDSGKRLPQLKWLLEGVTVPAERRRKIKGLTPYAKEIFKGGKPTDKQRLSLDAALNTPDLTIIIGPPGTGKTQVIAALQRRLAEEAQDQNISNQVLVCSEQHDAVDNALDRSDVFKLPPCRVGGKKTEAEDESVFEQWIERQAEHLQGKINSEYEKNPALKLVQILSNKLAFLRMSVYAPDQLIEEFEGVLDLTREIESQGLLLSVSLEDKLTDYLAALKSKDTAAKSSLDHGSTLQRIRALRVEPISFCDDGAERAWDLLRWLQRHHDTLDENLVQTLSVVADSKEMVSEQLMSALSNWRDMLLDQYLPDYRPPVIKNKLDDQGLKLLNQLENQIENKYQQRQQGTAWVLEQLADSLELDRASALAAVEEYSMVVGATCQQAASKKMASLKSVAGLASAGIEFDTVIVDEAARASPLDLFIPMAMASRRIVLVGDDRQLPHMLEPDIESELQEEHDLTEQQLAAFRTSLFERLRIKLLELQAQDNIPRVVMLDTQFRMHPVLGDFISKQFYESIGLGKVKSGRPEADFMFDGVFLSALGEQRKFYENKVCGWIDVPLADGADVKRGTSRIREAEVDRIAKEVQCLIQAGGESLSVGVITFYAAQRDLIMDKLTKTKVNGTPLMIKKKGTIEPHDNFKWALKEKADGSTSREERLRVGSVDAFQGKEFDIVLLSCVRTYKPQKKVKPDANKPEDIHNEAQLSRQFGFLRLPNRMNVAMSRQRQMLICIGDAELAKNQDSQLGVPALAAFHKLCGGVRA